MMNINIKTIRNVGNIHLVLCYSGNQVYGIVPFKLKADAMLYADEKNKANPHFEYVVDTRRIR